MAEVYLATVDVAQGLHKQVVIKKIRPEFAGDPGFTAMFVEEAKIALGLNHANLVQVFDFGEVRGQLYLAMEWVDGIDLMQLMHRLAAAGTPIPAVIAAYLTHQVAAALSYAHQKTDDFGRPLSITHRDVSPHNIMVSRAGTVKLLDFGIAKQATEKRADTTHVGNAGMIHGKLAYMSPEHSSGMLLDARTDLYSLGVVLYEMLAGTFVHRNIDLVAGLAEVRSEQLPPLGEIAPSTPLELQDVVTRALQPRREQRWASAREMQSALATFLHRADPVVDDEVLSTFLHTHVLSDAGEQALPGAVDPTAVVVSRPDIAGEPHPRPDPDLGSRVDVTVLQAQLIPRLQTAQPPDYRQLGRLVMHLAETRGAEVLRCDTRDITLVFGALGGGLDPRHQAVAAALALCEAVGMVGHGLGLGIAIAKMYAHLSPGPPLRVSLPPDREAGLASLAAAVVDGPIWVCGDLPEQLAETWSFDRETPVPQIADTLFSEGAALLGPVVERDRRRTHAPGPSSRLYGRELELRSLRNCLTESLRSGLMRAALVVGEPGHGKQALLRTFLKSLPQAALTIIQITGQWRRRNVSLGVLLDILQTLLELPREPTKTCINTVLEREVPDPELRAAYTSALLDALTLSHDTQPLRTDTRRPWRRRELLWRLVKLVLAARAQIRPVVLLIESLHLIDDHSFQRIRGWLEQGLDPAASSNPHAESRPVLVLMSSRPGVREQSLRSIPELRLLEVRELDPTSARDMITQRFADPKRVHDLAESILARTGGNPMFIEETLADLLRRDIIRWGPDGRYLHLHRRNPALTLPPSIEAAIETRVDTLDPAARSVLNAAAVLGFRFRVAELERLVARDCQQDVQAFISAGLLTTPAGEGTKRLQFASRSLHDVCKASLSPARRHVLHREAAALKLARADYTPGRDDGPIADHLAQAQALDEAVDPALRAAAHARAAAGNVEAYYFLSLALQALAVDDPRRISCLIQRDDILRTWGRYRAQAANLRLLSDCVSARQQAGLSYVAAEATTLTRLMRFYLECERINLAQQLHPRLEAAVKRLEDAPPSEPALRVDPLQLHLQFSELTARLLRAQGHFARAVEHVDQTLEHCPDTEVGQYHRARLELAAARSLCGQADYATAVVRTHRALDLARNLGFRRLQAEALAVLGEATALSTRYQEAITWFRQSLAIDRELGDRFATGTKLANLGITYTAIGLYDRAIRFLRKALELHEGLGQGSLRNEVLINLGVALAAQGQRAVARGHLTEATANARQHGDTRALLRARSRLVLLSVADLLAGEPTQTVDEMIASAQEVLADAERHQQRSPATRVLHTLSLLAEHSGDLEAAIDYERRAVDMVVQGAAALDGVLSVHHLGALLRTAGQAADGEKLQQHAREMTQARLNDLQDETLRKSYLAQPEVRQILGFPR